MVRYGDGDFFGGRRLGGKSFTLVISAAAGQWLLLIAGAPNVRRCYVASDPPAAG